MPNSKAFHLPTMLRSLKTTRFFSMSQVFFFSAIIRLMIHFISGALKAKNANHIVVEVGGVGFKIFPSRTVYDNLPSIGEKLELSAFLYVREDALELYGFTSDQELHLFEKLNSISGIGPKSALGILGITSADRLIAAIQEGKAELLTKVSGVGRKTAERIVLELKDKLKKEKAPHLVSLMESDVELEETLVSLGYTKRQAQDAIAKINPEVVGFKNRLKEALKNSKKTNSSLVISELVD
jgi:holliday junction DNA helicase RuvA